MAADDRTKSTLWLVGGLGAMLACCLGPLILVGLGAMGAWLGHLTWLVPYRPWLLGAALVAFGFAGRRIYRPADACQPGAACASAPPRRGVRILFWSMLALVLVALGLPLVTRLFH
ncbi:mercuric transporter MerT family protein [Paraburkholderia fungorum]|uniref:Mercuric transport protein MerT n=1 Tax=Paraburkholderia fungorum TaxID=134537 RepID=A0AAW3V3T3_9BURK|nr:mercuric transporter MerT family protein [Paraburkholderia fungorum]MBB4517484.1 mercuric ion transport protein [Paraburkholderia fungorum]MBB6204552.1 mercuric ion transport protein [Paraburkholderia fungorum]